MKRAIVLTLLVLSSGVLFAQTANEIPCWVLAAGGGGAGSATHGINATLGQPVVGISGSPGGQVLVHGYLPCSRRLTAVEENPSSTPSAYTLHQNSPNPFNPRTLFRYDVPAPGGHVGLKVYDVSGRHVCTLVDRNELPGQHQVTWTGTDNNGRSVASGLYIAVLETPTGRFNKKMALIR